MLRIVIESENGVPTVRAEGQMVGPWVGELERSCEPLARTGLAPILDLGRVSFVDRGGVELIRALSDRGMTVINCSGFVAEQLKG